MIIPNGTIRIITTTGGGFADGKPQPSVATATPPITANISEASRSRGEVGEQTVQTQAAYTILVAPEDAPRVSDHDRVEVTDSRGTVLGTFAVKSARPMLYVDALQINA